MAFPMCHPSMLRRIMFAVLERLDDVNIEFNNGYGRSITNTKELSECVKEYKNDILPKGVKTFVIEASPSLSLYKYVTGDEYMFTIDDFGSSGKRYDVLDKYGFNIEKIEKELNSYSKSKTQEERISRFQTYAELF